MSDVHCASYYKKNNCNCGLDPQKKSLFINHNLTTDVQISPTLFVTMPIADGPFKPGAIEHAIMSVCVDRFDCRPFVMEISLHSGNNGQGLGRGHRVKACNSYSY